MLIRQQEHQQAAGTLIPVVRHLHLSPKARSPPLPAAAPRLLARSRRQARKDAWKPETFELANGMKAVVLPDHRAPVVTHMLWYRVGSADEEKGKSGLAHFLEHLMFKATDEIPAGEYSKIVARNGGQDNAATYFDYTNYSFPGRQGPAAADDEDGGGPDDRSQARGSGSRFPSATW